MNVKQGLKPLIGWYKNRGEKTGLEIDIETFFLWIRSNENWKKQAEYVRAVDHVTNKAEYAERKGQSECVTIGGTFGVDKQVESLVEPSGLIAIDLDHLNESVEETKNKLKNDPFVYAVFLSIGGRGLCVIFRIDSARFVESFNGLAEYLITKYGLVNKQFDKSSSNINRLRYISYDANVFVNNDALIFRKYPRKEKKEAAPKNYTHTTTDLDYILSQIHGKGLDLTADYNDWYKIGWSLISEYGDGARGYFHEISQYNSNYNADECDKKFKYLIATRPHSITIKTFYWFCKQAGISIIKPLHQQVQSIAGQHKKQRISEESTSQTILKMLPDVEPGDVAEIVKQVFASDYVFDSELTLFDEMSLFLKSNYDLRFNEVRLAFEFGNGKVMQDMDFNKIYVETKNSVGEKVQKGELETLLYSNTVFPSFHPIKEFFAKNIHIKKMGHIDALIDTIETDTGFEQDGQFFPGYTRTFLRKWCIGWVATVFGEPCPLVPILTGVDGSGKTEWFRRLMPVELTPYFFESKWKDDKDEEIAMTTNWFSFNDEFKGSQTREMAHFKSLTSKDYFTIRLLYAKRTVRLQRLAIMCATSNPKNVISEPEFNRRIIPVNVLKIDFAAYNAIDKTELIMEIYHAYKSGESHHLTRQEINALKENTEAFQNKPIEQQLVEQYLAHPSDSGGQSPEFLSTTEILGRLEMKVNNRKLDINKIGAALSAGKFEKKQKRVRPPKLSWGYSIIFLD